MVASDPRTRTRADLALLAMTAAWGSTFVIVQGALRDAPPQAFLAMRFWLASALVAGAGLVLGAPRDGAAFLRGCLLGIPLWAGFVLQTHGLLSTTPSRSAFLTGLAVLFVPLLGGALRWRWPAGPTWIGVLLAVLGLSIMTRPWEGGGETLEGDLLTALAAFTFAFQILGTEAFSPGRPLLPLVLGELVTVAVLTTIGSAFEGGDVRFTPELLGAVAGTAVVATAFAFFVQTWAQQRTTAARTALIFATEPVFASVFAAAAIGERLGTPAIAGGALIVAGVLVAELMPLVKLARD